MRFSISKKVILVGAGVSFLLMLISFIVSFFVYQNNAKHNLKESVDSSLHDFELTVTDKENITDILALKEKFLSSYESVADEKLPKFETYEDEYNYYYSRYEFIYFKPKPGSMGMFQQKEKAIYMEYSGYLSSAVVTSRGVSSWFCYFDRERNRYVYMIDSSYRFDTYNGVGHLFGSYHELNENDKLIMDPNEVYDSYEINGVKTRFTDIYYENDKNEKEYLGTLFIEYNEKQLYSALSSFFITESIALSIALVVLIIIYIFLLRYFLLKNLNKLNDATKSFTNNILSNNNLEVIDPNVKASDEIGDISRSFVILEKEIIDYTKRIEDATKEKERMNAELSVASQIQLESLPKNHINDKNVLVASSITSAKEVGGDFYDYFYIDDTHLALIISDVSGKGIPASLFMMRSKELIKSKLLTNKSLEDVLFEVNNELLENNEAGLFITSFIGVLDIKTNVLNFINAGHERPFLISDNEIKKLDVESNFILGGMENFKYVSEKIKLKENDILFMHTDGLNEAINDSNEEFGYDRIKENLDRLKNEELSNILANMAKALDIFTETQEPFDDVTMLIFELKSQNLNFHFENPTYKIIEKVTNKFNDYYSYLDKSILANIDIIFDELLNNYISYEKNDNLYIDISIDIKDNKLYLDFKNNGDDFNPLDKKDKYIKEYSDDLALGGFGITIIKKIVDDIKYERINDINHLCIIKTIK